MRLWASIARACPEQLEEEQEELLAAVLRALGELCSDESKTVRFRACQLLSQILNNLPVDMSPLPDDDMDTLQDQLLERLDDKVAAARAMAAQALKRLPQPEVRRRRATHRPRSGPLRRCSSPSSKPLQQGRQRRTPGRLQVGD